MFRAEAYIAAQNGDYRAVATSGLDILELANALDPFTDLPFIYRLIGSTFHLYSTGPKMVDGGGKTGPWPLVAAGCADLYLDADDYWEDS